MEHLEAGDRLDEFLDDYPTVTRDQAVELLERATTSGGVSSSGGVGASSQLTYMSGAVASRISGVKQRRAAVQGSQ